MARRAIVPIGIAVLTIAVWLANRTVASTCKDAVAASAHAVHEFSAVEVIARPWLGPHHVYALFVVPDGYADRRYEESVRVCGYQETFARTRFLTPQRVGDVTAPRGQYVKRSYLPTRVALWFLVTGRFADLRSTANWTLVFTDLSSQTGDPAQ